MARVLACGWRSLGGGWRLCNRDSTPPCIARLVVGDAFCLGDDRTDVHGRDAFGPVGGTISPGSRGDGATDGTERVAAVDIRAVITETEGIADDEPGDARGS